MDKKIECTMCQGPCPFIRYRVFHSRNKTAQNCKFICGIPILLRLTDPAMLGYKKEQIVTAYTREGFLVAVLGK